MLIVIKKSLTITHNIKREFYVSQTVSQKNFPQATNVAVKETKTIVINISLKSCNFSYIQQSLFSAVTNFKFSQTAALLAWLSIL